MPGARPPRSRPTGWRRARAAARGAEQVLLRLCAEDPEDPEPWHLRLWWPRLLGLPRGEARRRYVRLHDADPHHHAGQRRICGP